MGCDAQITIARIKEGHHLIDMEKDPVFRVFSPVAVLPVYVGSFRKIPSFYAYEPFEDVIFYDEFFRKHESLAVQSVPLINWMEQPVFGIQVWQIETLDQQIEQWRKSQPGGKSLEYLLPTWEKITPGIWGVTEYAEYGTGNDDAPFYWNKEGVEFDQHLNWEIWT